MEHKSEQMSQTALAHGWKTQIKTEVPASGDPDEIIWNLYALRDRESLHVVYQGNKYLHGVYHYGDRTNYPHCRSLVIKIIVGKPNPRKLRLQIDSEEINTDFVPFDAETPALNILLAVLGKDITWVRKLDGEIMTASVDKYTNLGKKYFRVYTTRGGRRILEWQNREGFHAVGLDQIINIS